MAISRTELCQWLRNNSSGIYGHAADAADEIEMLAQLSNQHFLQAMKNGEEVRRLREENERLKADAERLIWLSENWGNIYGEVGSEGTLKITSGKAWIAISPEQVRKGIDIAIDAAREGVK